MGQKVVVTGATGHIGFHVAKLLLSRGYEVTVLARRESTMLSELMAMGARSVFCDLSDPSTFRGELAGSSVLFHLAAPNTLGSTAGLADEILCLTKSVIGAAIAAGVPKIVYTSSVVVLGRSDSADRPITIEDLNTEPESPYVEGKLKSEMWVRERVKEGIDIRTLYPSWVVGPGDPGLTPPHKFIRDVAIKGQLFHFDGGVSIAHVDDVALGHIGALELGVAGGRYILSGNNQRFDQLYQEISEIFGKAPPRFKMPKNVMWLAATMLGKLSPISPNYVSAVVGRFSWYQPSMEVFPAGHRFPTSSDIIASVKPLILSSIVGTDKIRNRKTPATPQSGEPLLITGFPGWLGNRVVDILMNGDDQGRYKTTRKIRLLVLPSLVNAVPKLPDNFEIVVGDVTDKDSLDAATKGVSAIWHLAGVIYPSKISDFDRVNYQGTVYLADAAVKNKVSRFLFMSTDSCSGYSPEMFSENESDRPYSDYGRTKLAAENYLLDLSRAGHIKATSLRGFWFFGPNPPPRNMGFLNSFKLPFQPMFGDGKNIRSISHCDDIVSAFVLAENSDAAVSKWYWLPSLTMSVNDIYGMVSESFGRQCKPVRAPNFVCSLLARADKILVNRFGHLHPTLHAAGKFHRTIATNAAGREPAKHDFGWEPSVTRAQIQKEIAKAVS